MTSTPPAPGPRPGTQPGKRRQEAIYRAGVFGKVPSVPTNFSELERTARQRMSKVAWAYVAGGAGEGTGMDNNRAALDRWAIVPRMLRDTSERDLSIELFGRRLPAPVLVAPVGAAGLVLKRADVEIGAAAASIGVPYIYSNQGSAPMEDTAAEMDRVAQEGGRDHAPRWFQLYWSTNDAVVESLIRRAEDIDCDALVVTLDTTQLGWRPKDLNIGSLPFTRGIGIAQYISDTQFAQSVRERIAQAQQSGPRPNVQLSIDSMAATRFARLRRACDHRVGGLRTLITMARNTPGGVLRNLRSPVPSANVETFMATYSRPALNWDDIAGLRNRTRLPILLKGILHPDDARRAVDIGVDGIVVSNHGARQVDSVIGTADALVDIVAAVGDQTCIVFDSGIRTGADIFKALALGAKAVTVGRPHIYGLALAGRRGVTEVLENLIAEFDLTLGLSGLRSITELNTEALRQLH